MASLKELREQIDREMNKTEDGRARERELLGAVRELANDLRGVMPDIVGNMAAESEGDQITAGVANLAEEMIEHIDYYCGQVTRKMTIPRLTQRIISKTTSMVLSPGELDKEDLTDLIFLREYCKEYLRRRDEVKESA